MSDPLDALRALVEAGRITPDCDLGAAGRAREALHRLAPELLAVVEAAQGLLADADAAVRHAELRASGGQVAGAAPARSIRYALSGPVRALDAKLEGVTR